MTILDEYFYLSDYAGSDSNSMEKLCSLFAKDAILLPNGESEIRGLENITSFFSSFFEKNIEIKHVWETEVNGEILETKWAVCGKRKTGEIFSLKGKDTARVNSEGKIEFLEVKVG